MKTIGEKIKELREQHNMSATQFALSIEVDLKTVRNWETNRNGVKSDYVYVICDEYNVTPNWLFGYEE